MPSQKRRARRRQSGSMILPGLIVILALVAASLTAILIISDPLKTTDENNLPFTYPENPNFVEHKNATAAPLVLGSDSTPLPENNNPAPTPTPQVQMQPELQPENGNRLVPAPEEGDYFLPVFDKALRTPDDEAMIAVTVDDCDNLEAMSAIITIAQKYKAKLTLFPTGEALMTPGMTEGFRTCVRDLDYELENHGYAGKAEYKLSSSELAIQLWKQSVAASYAVNRDYAQHFYRPHSMMSVNDQRTHFYINKLGYAGIAGYTVSYRDADSIDALVKTLANGNIYQFDMSEESMAMFEIFVAEASRKGYKLVTMNELFGLEENQVSDRLTLDQQTLVTMEDYVSTYYELKLNYRTNAVYALQTRLAELGYLDKGLRADGIYGPSTSVAVSAFQAKVGIAATGNADVATQEKLFAINAPLAG